jgi:hypothetical protein
MPVLMTVHGGRGEPGIQDRRIDGLTPKQIRPNGCGRVLL